MNDWFPDIFDGERPDCLDLLVNDGSGVAVGHMQWYGDHSLGIIRLLDGTTISIIPSPNEMLTKMGNVLCLMGMDTRPLSAGENCNHDD